jgi:hypothetical protein
MEDFEKKALTSFTGLPPRVWLRYVDDTFVILKQQELSSFFDHLNNIDSNIKFTQEGSHNNSLPFLDCLITIKDSRLQTKVYRKPTHTDQYLAFDSNHPLIHKLGVIRTLQHRANTVISEPSEIVSEHNSIKQALRYNGYPDWAFHKVEQLSRRPPPETNSSHVRNRPTQVIIPYIQGTSERLQKAFKKQGINTIYKPVNNLRGQLVKVKDKTPIETQSNLIYSFVCHQEGCKAEYIGETKQALKSRVSQHRRPSTGDTYDSAIFTHMRETGHTVDIKDFKVLDKEEDWHKRGVKEAIWERIKEPTLNKKGGLRFNLPHTWDRALQQFSHSFP